MEMMNVYPEQGWWQVMAVLYFAYFSMNYENDKHMC